MLAATPPPPNDSLSTLLISRDVLPFTLKLPEAIATAKSPTDLAEVAKLGAGLILLHTVYIYFFFIRLSLMGSKDYFLYLARAREKVWRVLVGVTC